MNGLISASLRNPYAVTVMCLTLVMLGTVAAGMIPIDILPVFKSPAVQVLTFYGGMPAASVEKDISNRMERWVGQANGTSRQESRSIVGASIVRDYFRGDVDPNGALTQVNSLALAAVPNLPPGTLPPVVLPFDPTSTTPVCIVAVDSPDHSQNESILYDVGRYEVRNMIMGVNGAVAPVVYGGKIRAVLAYLDRQKLQARGLSPIDVMNALDNYNLFLPTGDAKLGDIDYALDSNSMYDAAAEMGSIPLRTEFGNVSFLRDVATPKDASFIQTNVVRINGKREVYIPVFRQLGASTLGVVETVRKRLPEFAARLTRSGVDLKLVMDQSVYVRQSIQSLIQEGVLGAILCSLTILLFLGQWRMTAIAVMTLPISVLSALIFLYFTGNTVNVMTLAGLTLAIGPMVDSAIICLENTHRHPGMGVRPMEAAFLGASEVAMPELVSTLCTFLVLAPLALMPGLGEFLFRPMALAVAFAMCSAYLLSRTLVPACSAYWLKGHGGHGEHGHGQGQGKNNNGLGANGGNGNGRGMLARGFARWEAMVDRMFEAYARGLDVILRHRLLTIGVGFGLLAATLVTLWPVMRKEFFPEVDAGAFEMYVRAPSGTRIERTEEVIAQVEKFLKKTIPAEDLELYISELGVNSDWSAAYTPNAGPMDAVIKVQLKPERSRSAQEYVHLIRVGVAKDPRFMGLDFAFDAGGLVRNAMNEGKSTPINIRVTGKHQAQARAVAEKIRNQVVGIDGVVDARIIQMAFRKPGTFLLEEGLQALRSCRQTHRWKEPLLDPSEGHPDMAEVLVAPAEGASQARDACEGPGHALSLQGDPRSRARQDAHHDRRGRALREVPGVPRRRAVPHRGLGGARRPARGQWTVQDHPGLPGRTAPLRRADATRVRLQAPHLDPGVADARPRRAGRGRDQHRRHEPTPGPVGDRAEAAQAGREMPLEGRAAEAAVAADRAAGEAPARRRGRRLRRRGRHPSQPRGRAGLDEAWSTEGGGDARTQREALPRRRVGPPGAPTHLCRRRAEEQPAVPATALQAGHEELPERQADPCNPRQLRHPRQRAGAAGDEVGGGGAVGAPLPAAVLPGPQPDRAHLEGPARQRHPQPPLRVDGGAHGRGALLLGGSKPLRAPHVCPDEEGMTRRAPQSRKAIYSVG